MRSEGKPTPRRRAAALGALLATCLAAAACAPRACPADAHEHAPTAVTVAASAAAPASAPAPGPSPAPAPTDEPNGEGPPAPSGSVAALVDLVERCWRDNEGAESAEQASVSVTVTVGPPRSVLVSAPERSRYPGLTSCVVLRASEAPLVPGPDGRVRAKVALR